MRDRVAPAQRLNPTVLRGSYTVHTIIDRSPPALCYIFGDDYYFFAAHLR
jgi:hypothetical protein